MDHAKTLRVNGLRPLAIGMIAAFGCALVFYGTVLRSSDSVEIRRYVESFSGSEPDSLSPIADYLGRPLKEDDFDDFSKRAEFVASTAKRSNVRMEISAVLSLLDERSVENACLAKKIGDAPRTSDHALLIGCERLRIENAPRAAILDCSEFQFENARGACRERNDTLLSRDSLSHCERSECLIDNAVFQWLAEHPEGLSNAACERLPKALERPCGNVLEKYSQYAADPKSFLRDDLENLISGIVSNEAERAARSAVIEHPDSPSSACSSLGNSDMREKCESISKELFSYVPVRSLRKRFERIREVLGQEAKSDIPKVPLR